jgi:hypothetical protein
MKNKLQLLILSCLFFFITVASASAATLTGTIGGIDTELIESFTLVFDVDDSFALSTSTFGDAIPSAISYGWSGDFTAGTNTLTISNADYDALIGSSPNPLNNGQLFNIDYTGLITGLSKAYFFDMTGLDENVFTVEITNPNWLADGNLQFDATNAVPIPSALLLLGSGLLGLVGLRRKRMS